MPWKHDGKIIPEGRAWSDKYGTQHPSNWAIWPDPEKEAREMTWEDPPKTYANRFYWAAGIEKRLEDSSAGTTGLKTQWINSTKDTANSLLQLSDWYVTRKSCRPI